MEPIRTAIVDDQQLFLDGIRALLDTCPELNVVGTACSGEEALVLVADQQPDVLLLDLSMPGMDGLEVLPLLQRDFPSVKVMMLTVHEDLSLIQSCLQQGAMGYILKINGKDELLRAILDIAGDRRYLDPKVTEILIGGPQECETLQLHRGPNLGSEKLLTKREQEILHHLAKGETSSNIAELLFISVNTVDTHRKNIISKLGAHNITDAVRIAMQKKLIQ